MASAPFLSANFASSFASAFTVVPTFTIVYMWCSCAAESQASISDLRSATVIVSNSLMLPLTKMVFTPCALARFASVGTAVTLTACSGRGPKGVYALCRVMGRGFSMRAAAEPRPRESRRLWKIFMVGVRVEG